MWENYERLVKDVDVFCQQLKERFSQQITCHLGCTGCCQQHLSLFPIEAALVKKTVQEVSKEIKQRVVQNARQFFQENNTTETCPLLLDGQCSIYSYRPIICRTHGYPISFQEKPQEVYLDVCPLNFSQEGEFELLQLKDSIPLERLNLRLAAINYTYCKELNRLEIAGERQSIASIILNTDS